MRKLIKANNSRKDSIEAYGNCNCTCSCTTSSNQVTKAVSNSASRAMK